MSTRGYTKETWYRTCEAQFLQAKVSKEWGGKMWSWKHEIHLSLCSELFGCPGFLSHPGNSDDVSPFPQMDSLFSRLVEPKKARTWRKQAQMAGVDSIQQGNYVQIYILYCRNVTSLPPSWSH